MREKHSFGRGAKVDDVRLHVKETRSELLVDLDEGFQVLLAGGVRGMFGSEGGDEAWIFQN